MSMMEVDGQYSSEQEHSLEQDILSTAIAGLEGAATRFSLDAISDANVRQSYQSNIRRMANEVKEMVKTKKITIKEGAEFCYEMRNKIMAEHRKITSVQGLAKAQQYKLNPQSLDQLYDKVAKRQFGESYKNLTPKQQSAVQYGIIESSAKDNAKFTSANKRLKILGKVGIIVTASLATYEILNAENKPKEAVRQGIQISGGVAGGWLAGLAVSTVCGPGAPICAVALILAGSVVGGVAGSYLSDYLDEEIEEFTKWQIN
ncbi:hypothetical protein [Enterovibrio norvegicus]|uniref:hypothetical protein n=1 Tax=Enterovibrio norvegicus TaxID=188144 RepID=UPI0018E43E39|nr:hypothetical protein [Enterovibrio norvegicus]